MEIRWNNEVMWDLAGTLPAGQHEQAGSRREEGARADMLRPGSSGDGSPPSEGDMERMAEEVREMNRVFQRELDFRVDDELERIVIEVRDRERDEVIRQIPTERMLELARSMERIRGLLFNEST